MKKGSPHASSGKDDWQTPRRILDPLERFLPIDLDPCAGLGTRIGGENWPESKNGLGRRWFGHVFVNPPYSELRKWCGYALTQAPHVAALLLLIPSRTETRAFQPIVRRADCILFIRGRLKFIDPATGEEAGPAPFPSALVYFGRRESEFRKSFEGEGEFR